MKFLENKYTNWYFKIVNNRRANPLDGYTERHHVIPLSMGGPNVEENCVYFSAREHFIAHMLLLKMTRGEAKRSMSFAIHCMMHWKGERHKRYSPRASKLYEIIRKEVNANMKLNEASRLKKSQSMKGRKHSDETKAKIRKGNLGKIVSAETRAKQSAKFKGKIVSEETRRAQSLRQRGKPGSAKHRLSMEMHRLKFVYTIIDQNGVIYELDNIKTFCLKHKLPHTSLRQTFITKKPAVGSRNKNIQGWQCVNIQEKKNLAAQFSFCSIQNKFKDDK